MSLTDKTLPAQTQSLSFELELRHAPSKVWRALTDPELLVEWLLPVVNFKLGAGNAFALQAPPQPGWDGQVQCRFLEIEAQKKLSYSWVVGGMDTVVTFTLTPTPTGTLLSLVHAGFKEDQAKNWGGARYGWRLMANKLVDVLDRAG